MKKDQVLLERLKAEHIKQVVELHLELFPNDFITLLGRRFLECAFYPLFVTSPGIGLVANHCGKVVGYIVGGKDLGDRLKGGACRAQPAMVGEIVSSLLHSFLKVGRMLPRLSREWRIKYPPDGGVLAYIGVARCWQGRGLGRQLVKAFVHLLREQGTRECYVKGWAENIPGQRLYLSCGFRVWKEFNTFEGLRRVYRLELGWKNETTQG